MQNDRRLQQLPRLQLFVKFAQRRCVRALHTGWCFAIHADRPHMRRRLGLDWAGTPMCRVRGSSPMDSNGHTWAYPLRVDRSGPVNVFESLRRTVSSLPAQTGNDVKWGAR
jgi:hypothetical protein